MVTDDGSRYETSEVARGYPELRFVRQEDAGVAVARNRGVRETSLEWVVSVDADDPWMPKKLGLQFAKMMLANGAAHERLLGGNR